jgi:6-pyruvoyltetrahydropterin/6-carboxytetrahydropterin synthase
MRVFIEDSFDSAHWLPNVPDRHKCKRLHGHTYRIRIEIEGPVDQNSGWIIDYAEIKAFWEPLKSILDHHCLNEIAGLQNPTNENNVDWVRARIPGISRLEIRETEHCGVVKQ